MAGGTALGSALVGHRRTRLENAPGVDRDACFLGDEVWDGNLAHLDAVSGAYALARPTPDGMLLARDAIGERTLFYREDGAFSSTLRPLLPARPEIDPLGLALFLCCAYIPGRRTLVKGVYEMLPGERRLKGQSRMSWTVPSPLEGASEEELRLELRAALERALSRRWEPGCGATLSGGIDSSLVVALAARLGELRTYSLSFGEGYANELPFSNAVAAHCRTRHRIVELSPARVSKELDRVVGWLDKPNGDPLTVPNAVLFETAAQEVGVLLNGEGGDPCFGGPKNLPMLLSELYGSDEREASYLRSHLKCYDDLQEMLHPDLWEALRLESPESFLEPYLRSPDTSLVQKLMRLNLLFKGAHHILPKVDSVSYPYGVMPRSPLFDRDLVELAFRLPPRLKLKGSVEKYLLKRAVADLLPREVVERPKSGMLVPVEAWFSGPLLEEARARLLDGLAPRGLIRSDYLERLLEGTLGGLRPRRGVKIWLLITLESWLRSYF